MVYNTNFNRYKNNKIKNTYTYIYIHMYIYIYMALPHSFLRTTPTLVIKNCWYWAPESTLVALAVDSGINE